MRKRPLLLAASFFLAGIAYAAERNISIILFLPFGILYVLFPQIKTLGWNKKSLCKSVFSGILLVTGFVMGVSRMEQQLEFRETYLSKLVEDQQIVLLGKISKIETNTFGYQIVVSDCYIFQNSRYIPCNQVLVYTSDSQFHVGEIHKIIGNVHMFSQARNEGNFDRALYYQSQKIDFSINMETTEYVGGHTNVIIKYVLKLKELLGNVYQSCLNERHAGILQGMVLGDKSALDEEVKDLFTAAGISHILAISGLHVSVIGRSLYNWLRKRGCGFGLSGIIASIVLLLYGIMTGNGVSARRAIGMLLLFMLGQVFGRSYDMLNGLGAMCIYLLWENPFLIGYSGVWFFIAALFGVGFVGTAFSIPKGSDSNQSKEEVQKRKTIFYKMKNACWTNIGITITTLPIAAYCYFEVSMVSFLINCIILPFLTPLFFFAIVGGLVGIFWMPLAKWFFYPCTWILSIYEEICSFHENISFFHLITGRPEMEKIIGYYLVLTCGILFLQYQKELRQREQQRAFRQQLETGVKVFLTMFCFGFLMVSPTSVFEITFLDVGQGDGIYICDGSGSHFFIDGGSSDEKELGKRCILPFLKSRAIRKIDYWFVTHADTDHISGVLEILESGYEITYLVLPKAAPKDENYEQLVLRAKENGTTLLYMETGNYIKTKSLKFDCLYPQGIEMQDRNDTSLVLELEKDTFRAIFTGDISSDVEKQLVEQGLLKEVVLYKAAHHGSKGSNSTIFLQTLLPKITVISCGEKNRYGHPAAEAVERIEAVHSQIYYTTKSGQITVKLEKEGRICIDKYKNVK